MNKKHKFKYLKVIEGNPRDNEWVIWKEKKVLAIFYDLDLALQTAYFLDELFDINNQDKYVLPTRF